TLNEPPKVVEATSRYRENQDILANFLQERCRFEAGASILTKDLWVAYKGWCEENDSYRLGQRTFYDRIREKGINDQRGAHNKSYFHGIRLLGAGEANAEVTEVTNGYLISRNFPYKEIPKKLPEKSVTLSNQSNPLIPSELRERPAEDAVEV
ncbi:MAG: primase-like DNA-binding domain-containing protein, partial [Chloroflexota bacterium]